MLSPPSASSSRRATTQRPRSSWVSPPRRRIVVVNWTPDSAIGELLKRSAATRRRPAFASPPALWAARSTCAGCSPAGPVDLKFAHRLAIGSPARSSLSVHCLNPCDRGVILGIHPGVGPPDILSICRHFGRSREAELLLAMQKVEGSNPFSRFQRNLHLRICFCVRSRLVRLRHRVPNGHPPTNARRKRFRTSPFAGISR